MNLKAGLKVGSKHDDSSHDSRSTCMVLLQRKELNTNRPDVQYMDIMCLRIHIDGLLSYKAHRKTRYMLLAAM